jgi:hypothetical protein
VRFHHRAKRAARMCCVCKKAPIFQYGRCPSCFRAMDPAVFARLKKLSRADRNTEFEKLAGASEMPPWEYEPTPAQVAELIATHGEQNG